MTQIAVQDVVVVAAALDVAVVAEGVADAEANMDRIGIGWRRELAAEILCYTDNIDVVEIIIENYTHTSLNEVQALKTLAAQIPIVFHGVSLGLASTHLINLERLKMVSNFLKYFEKPIWSEHLSFVRAGDHEIGHLAAPPRNSSTIEGTLRNLEIVYNNIGSLPILENIASLIDPPGSTLLEPEWVSEIIIRSGANLLLDLHNLYANALNFGHNVKEYLLSFPLEKVKIVHLSGGKWIEEPEKYKTTRKFRLLDDHRHDVPDELYELLGIIGEKTVHPLTVIIERDGQYPTFNLLVQQIEKARSYLQKGRNRQLLREVSHDKLSI